MVALVRVGRVLVILVLALLTISFVIGVGRPETGPVEKVVLLALVAGCVFLAARVSSWAADAQERLGRRRAHP